MSLTSSCPGTDETKRMLRETAARVGARFAMLVAPDGTLEACGGLDDRFTAEIFASSVADAVRSTRLMSVGEETGAFVELSGVDELARLTIRRIETGRLLVIGFELTGGELGRVRVGSAPPDDSLDAGAEVPMRVHQTL